MKRDEKPTACKAEPQPWEITKRERDRCIRLIGRYLTGEIKTQWELRDLIESGSEA